MIDAFNVLRGTDVLSTVVKMVVAAVCGGCIGLEREYKQRTAGFRTHILISIGSAMTMVTSQFMVYELRLSTDPGRLGAQVVAGIGFIGAGSIIVSKRNRVKGLTTAAGLWTTAVVGLASGAAFYECGILATILILFAELILSKLEHILRDRTSDIDVYVEYTGTGYLFSMFNFFKERDIIMKDVEIVKDSGKKNNKNIAVFTIRSHKKENEQVLLKEMRKQPQTIKVQIL